MSNPAPSVTSNSSVHSNVIPSEVGWQFVPQYYTFVNKQPHRLHCFYTKTSTFIHGTEGEDGRPCYGQQEIHNRILSIGFQDCKVFIHSVDAQASANGGIIIQVIGEMSNKGEAWRKFVQTFFLAEQPNGYFVLNDIFRFLKEESVDSEEGSEAGPETESVPAAAPIEQQVTEPAPSVPSPAPVEVPLEPAAALEPTPVSAPEPPKPQPNGIHIGEPEKRPEPVDAPASPVDAPILAPEPEPAVEPEPTPAAAAASPAAQPPVARAPTPAAPSAPALPHPAPQPPTHAALAPPAATSAPAPAAPKTWANLAAANSKKWGAAVAQESRGTSEAVAPSTASTSAPPSGTQTPVTSAPRPNQGLGSMQGRDREPHPAFTAANSLTTAQVFVKGVVEPVSNSTLTQVLTNRFGPIKDLEVVRSKACAFLEFQNLDHAKRAIIASLPVSQGGEGGIRIDVGAESGPVRISIETKKERGERPPPRPRGGAPSNGEPRGGYRGGRGGGRGGRGGPPPGK